MNLRHLFDQTFYLTKYPDVANANIDPYTHFMIFGWKENRDPNLYFSTNFYKSVNPDVREENKNPLTHYNEFGIAELRDPSPWRPGRGV